MYRNAVDVRRPSTRAVAATTTATPTTRQQYALSPSAETLNSPLHLTNTSAAHRKTPSMMAAAANGVGNSSTSAGDGVGFVNPQSSSPIYGALPIGATISTHRALPGRTRRKRTTAGKSRRKTFFHRLYSRWVNGVVSSFSSLVLAVFLWYTLGIVSIGSSKVLLSSDPAHAFPGVSPLFLTLQQLLIGSNFLKYMLRVNFMGSPGLQPWPAAAGSDHTRRRLYHFQSPPLSKPKQFNMSWNLNDYQPTLVLAGVYFTLGFLATNVGFSGSNTAFVETIKAAEPITSAALVVLWGIETLSNPEIISLSFIVMGVALSTLANGTGSATASSAGYGDSLRACLIVMASNLCFSFRGLYQKIFRATPEGSTQVLDDMNIQYRMQQLGAYLLIGPVLVWNAPSMLRYWWTWATHHNEQSLLQSGLLVRYLCLALINGCAFTSYNLASTYILSRISVVHHAALNCIRRIFAIVVTSILFGIPLTVIGVLGIIISFLGFLSFTHYKVLRQRQPRPVSSLLPVSVSAANLTTPLRSDK